MFIRSERSRWCPWCSAGTLIGAVMVFVIAFAVQQGSAATGLPGIPQGKNVALIIGNNDYQHIEDLQTAVPDARAVGEILIMVGVTAAALPAIPDVHAGNAFPDYLRQACRTAPRRPRRRKSGCRTVPGTRAIRPRSASFADA